MKNYQTLLAEILANGTRQPNRTGTDTISIPGAMLKFDLTQGFPAVTTKKLAFKTMVGELIGFLRGYDNAADFRKLGCGIWNQNANENAQWLANPNRKGEDDLGRIYGVQWRHWKKQDGTEIDQVMSALKTIHERPTDRRIIISAWRPDEFEHMALPPCHIFAQFLANVERKELNLCVTMRSVDCFLGLPFNVSSYALLLTLFAHLTGYTPKYLTMFLGDTHIYVDHLDQVKLQLSREPCKPPRLLISERIPAYDGLTFRPELIDQIEPDDVWLDNYVHHPAIAAPMAV